MVDEEHRQRFEEDLQALATTEMASDTLAQLLTFETDREPWEVGEALAECLLADERGVSWPWNTERDKLTPRASLPGADLIGFIDEGDEILLVLGEVKTSNDLSTPPNVMHGRSGMIHQLDNLIGNLKVHACVLNWLRARCKNTSFWPLFERATSRYLESGGRALMLVGLLMRDTSVEVLDLEHRAKALACRIDAPTRVELHAWYLPYPIQDWPALVSGGVS